MRLPYLLNAFLHLLNSVLDIIEARASMISVIIVVY